MVRLCHETSIGLEAVPTCSPRQSRMCANKARLCGGQFMHKRGALPPPQFFSVFVLVSDDVEFEGPLELWVEEVV